MIKYIDKCVDEKFHVIIRIDALISNLGGVAYIIEGQMVGDMHRTGDLRVPLGYWEAYHAVPRRLDLVREMSPAQAWKFCDHQLYSDDIEYREIVVPSEVDISSNYSECFDGFPVFLISDGLTERFIWSTDNGSTAGECRLPVRTYEKTIQKVLLTLRELL